LAYKEVSKKLFNKTGKTKLLYVVIALTLLAMMIPLAATPVSADTYALTPAQSHDVVGDIQRFEPPLGTGTPYVVTDWSVSDFFPGTNAVIVNEVLGNGPVDTTVPPDGIADVPTVAFVEVQATTMGEAYVIATLEGGDTAVGDKKWGKIQYTEVYPEAQDVPLTWNEEAKRFEGSAEIIDEVTGSFFLESPVGSHNFITTQFPAEGAILHWYLLADTPANEAAVNALMGLWIEPGILNNAISILPRAAFTTFLGDGTAMDTTTDALGLSGVSLVNAGMGGEAVLVVIVPDYPAIGPVTEIPVQLETAKVNFWVYESEVVPQVRWVGEKIVLEKYFGIAFAGSDATVSVTGAGRLQSIYATDDAGTNILHTLVQPDGYVRAKLVCAEPQELFIDVDIPQYESISNEHAWVVYYLKFESITLGNVPGKRDGHDIGLWTPENPWDASNDTLTDELNVSQDTLLRANVKGWFMGVNKTSRPQGYYDPDPANPNNLLEVLPAQRYVLPDDWAFLANFESPYSDWRDSVLHWDIMDNPAILYQSTVNGDDIMSISAFMAGPGNAELGPYETNNGGSLVGPFIPPPVVVAYAPVIGPFRPQLEVPLPTPLYGYSAMIPIWADPLQKTVVPNNQLNKWDAPMPPAKITFKIINPDKASPPPAQVVDDIAGFFKDADKGEIYYYRYLGMDGIPYTPDDTIHYTAPFYQIMIPASEWIDAGVNNGGYDVDSWPWGLEVIPGQPNPNSPYGPYDFWTITNRAPNNEVGAIDYDGDPVTPDNANYPTNVNVYSDNHGEAMVYLNGDYNLYLYPWLTSGGYDIKPGTIVGETTVIAIARYPYYRPYGEFVSNTVVKQWTWGKTILGADPAVYGDGAKDDGYSIIDDEYPYGETEHSTRMVIQGGTIVDNEGTLIKSNRKVIWVWVTDRDGFPPIHEAIDWSVLDGTASIPLSEGSSVINNYNDLMKSIYTVNGFLAGTLVTNLGEVSGQIGMNIYRSYTIGVSETGPLAQLFYKFWGEQKSIDPAPVVWGPTADGPRASAFAVAAIVVENSNLISGYADIGIKLDEGDLGVMNRDTFVSWGELDSPDDPLILGDANFDGNVNMGDIIAIERMMLGLDLTTFASDANRDGDYNIADILCIEKAMLGLS